MPVQPGSFSCSRSYCHTCPSLHEDLFQYISQGFFLHHVCLLPQIKVVYATGLSKSSLVSGLSERCLIVVFAYPTIPSQILLSSGLTYRMFSTMCWLRLENYFIFILRIKNNFAFVIILTSQWISLHLLWKVTFCLIWFIFIYLLTFIIVFHSF